MAWSAMANGMVKKQPSSERVAAGPNLPPCHPPPHRPRRWLAPAAAFRCLDDVPTALQLAHNHQPYQAPPRTLVAKGFSAAHGLSAAIAACRGCDCCCAIPGYVCSRWGLAAGSTLAALKLAACRWSSAVAGGL